MKLKYLIPFLVFILVLGFIPLTSCKAEEIIGEEAIEEKVINEQIKEEDAKKEREQWLSNSHWKVTSLIIVIISIVLAFVLWRYSITIES